MPQTLRSSGEDGTEQGHPEPGCCGVLSGAPRAEFWEWGELDVDPTLLLVEVPQIDWYAEEKETGRSKSLSPSAAAQSSIRYNKGNYGETHTGTSHTDMTHRDTSNRDTQRTHRDTT